MHKSLMIINRVVYFYESEYIGNEKTDETTAIHSQWKKTLQSQLDRRPDIVSTRMISCCYVRKQNDLIR